MRKSLYAALVLAFGVAVAASLPIRAANEAIDYDAINKIKTRASRSPTPRSWKR